MAQRLSKAVLALMAGAVCGVAGVSPSLAARPGYGLWQDGARVQLADPTNAALLYHRHWETMNRESVRRVDDAAKAEGGIAAGSEADTLLAEMAAGPLGELLAATKIPDCDWGVEYSKGFNALVPHLGQMRRTARLFDARAMQLMRDGKPEEAAQWLAGVARMSDHLRQDRVLISPLVAVAIFGLVDARTKAWDEAGTLTPAMKRTLAEALATIDRDDLFGFKAAVAGEAEVFTRYLEKVAQTPDGAKKAADELSSLSEVPADVRAQIMAMTPEQIRASGAELRTYYSDVLAAWDQPDAAARIKALEEKLKSGAYGVMAKSFAATLPRAHDAAVRGDAAVKAVAARVSK